MNVAALADDDLARNGDYEALVVGSRTWSSRELHDDAIRLASAFAAAGVAPGDRVVLAVPSGRASLVASTAAWRCGAVVVYVSSTALASDLDATLAHCTPRAIVAGPALLAAIRRPPIAWSIAELDEHIARHAPMARPVDRSAKDPAQLVYTSGTTGGLLKAVTYSHGGICALLARYRALEEQKQTGTIVSLVALPPTSFAGMVLANRWTYRTKLVVLEQFDPHACLDAIARHHITRLSLVPSMGEALVAIANGRIESSVRELIVSGAHMSTALADALERTFGVRPATTYGMTEVGGAISWTTRDPKPGSVGKIVEGVEVAIVDGAGKPAAPGGVGEVCVRCPWMALGYWRDAAETAKVFRDGWIHTGDLGRLDPDGELYLVGRSKDIIIQSGFNVAPREVADVVCALPGIARCEVVGAPHAVLGEEVVACVVRAPGSAITAQDVLAHCRKRLDPRKLPGRVLFLDALPTSEGGKVKTAELREWVARASPQAEGTPFVRRLHAALPAERIGIMRDELVRLALVCRDPEVTTDIDPTATFADNKLASMDKVQLTQELSSLFGSTIAVTLTYRFPTIDELADELVRQLAGDGAQTAAPVVEPAAVQPHHDSKDGEPIAIVGIGCRLPGGVTDLGQLWELLRTGADTVRDAPRERWPELDELYDEGPPQPGKTYVRRASFLDGVDEFDAGFFGLASEAVEIDPQHRLLLEVTWEAIEDAGYDPRAVPGCVGMMIGISGSSYPSTSTLGNAASMVVGRIGHFLNLRGPAMAIDTSCSSSLVALHEAVGKLRVGECNVAVVAGVSVMSTPAPLVALCQLELLARDGRCRSFDASGIGFAIGEGAVAIVVKRLSDAITNGDQIHAVIRGTAINHDGHSSSLSAPNPHAQEEVMRAALAAARTAPDEVQYVEAHGTGTVLGDPIEVDALTRVFGGRRQPLAIGSIKSNIGHLSAAAGLAGLLKTVLAMRHRQLPASLHVHTPNPHIPWNQIPIRIQRELDAWPNPKAPLVAGLSSFGLSGTNAHVILAEAPAAVPASTESYDVRMLPISARTAPALRAAAARFADALEHPGATAADLAYTASCRRAQLSHRLVVSGATIDEWKQRLRAFASGQGSPHVLTGHAARPARVVFVFPGQGGQSQGMGRGLFAAEPVFRETIARCDAAMRPYTDWTLIEQLHASADRSRMSEIGVVQPMLFAMQVGLAAVLRSWGVEPSAVIGHSMGELAAACVAGVLSLEEAAKVMCIRARLLRRVTGRGGMAMLDLTAEAVEAEVAKYSGRVSIAAINGPRSTVVSGDTRDVAELVSALQARDVFARLVQVDFASHSSQIDELESELIAQLGKLSPRVAEIRFVSTTVIGAEPVLDARYWWLNLRNPVRLLPRIQQLDAEANTVFLEISPHPVLASSIGETSRAIGTLRRNEPERESLLESVGALHCAGYPVDWQRRYPTRGRVATLPTYAWEHQHYWIQPPRVTRRLAPLLHRHIALPDDPNAHLFELDLDLSDPDVAYLGEHVVQREIWLAASALLEVVLEGANHVYGARATGLRDVRFERALVMSRTEPITLQLVVRESRFEIFARSASRGSVRHVEGGIAFERADEVAPSLAVLQQTCTRSVSMQTFHEQLAAGGLEFGSAFRQLDALWVGDGEVLGRIRSPLAANGHRVHPLMLDAAFQAGAIALAEPEPEAELALAELAPAELTAPVAWVYARARRDGQYNYRDYTLLDAGGRVVARARGMRTEPIGAATAPDQWLYDVAWRAAPRAATGDATGTWLVFADREGVADVLCTRLAAAGARVVSIVAGDDYVQRSATRVEIRPDDATHLERALGDLLAGAPRRIVHLWSLDAAEHTTVDSLERAQRLGTLSLMRVVQTIARRGWDAATRLFVVTRGAQDAGSGSPGFAQSPIWGFAASVAHELPRLEPTLVDLDPRGSADELADELVHADGELRVALRGGSRLVPRLERYQPGRTSSAPVWFDVGDAGYTLGLAEPGRVASISLRRTARRAPGRGEVEIRVHACGLAARNALAGAAFTGACAGVVVRVGEGVTCAPGDEVVAIGAQIGAFVVLPAAHVRAKPAALGFEPAAATTAFATALHALRDVARLRARERILVHSAASGVGLAAIQYAKHVGADVIATAASHDERQYLHHVHGLAYVFDSRSPTWSEDVMHATDGRGVDVVLSSLVGEALVRGVSVLAPFGRFVELAGRDVAANAKLGLAALGHNASFSVIAFEELVAARPLDGATLLDEVFRLVEQRVFEPSRIEQFPIARAAEAYERAANGAQVVLHIEDHVQVRSELFEAAGDRTYLITGGLGGLGGVVARRLADLGARHIVLMGRHGADAAGRARIAELEAIGVHVHVALADVANPAALDAALDDIASRMPRIAGIVHAAGVLDDGVVSNLDDARVRAVLAPKLLGAWHLHQRIRDLDFFVLFSSVAGVLGSAGQAHYAAANAFLDELARYRRSRGLAAQSIAWGGWSEVGLAVGLARPGDGSITSGQGAALFERLLTDSAVAVAVLPGAQPWRHASFDGRTPALFAELAVDTQPASHAHSFGDQLRHAAGEAARTRLLEAYLREAIGHQLGAPPEDLSLTTPLPQLGIDSLATQRLRNFVLGATGLEIVLADMYGATIGELATRLAASVPEPAQSGTELDRGELTNWIELRKTGKSSARATLHQQLFWYVVRDAADANPWIWSGYMLDGPLDRGALDRSLTALVRGHSIFRTGYREVDGELELVVLDRDQVPPFELEYVDHAPVAETESNAELRRMVYDLVGRGLDRARGQVLRARLTRLGPDRHALVIVLDHIATDAGALGAFVRELLGLYAGECAGRPARVEPPFQFVDYADALVRWNDTAPGRAASAYWRERVRDVVPVDIACDLRRADVDRHRDEAPLGITASMMHAHERAEVPPACVDGLAELGRQTGATSAIVYLAALFWMLHRETGQTDICIEAVTSLRGAQPSFHRLQGMLSTWLLYRVNLAGCTRLADVVRRTKPVISEAQQHPIIDDYYRIVPHTVRRVVFNYIPPLLDPLPRVAGVDVEPRFEVTQRMKRSWDLHVNLIDRGSSAHIMWSGSEHVYSRERLAELLQRYREILNV